MVEISQVHVYHWLFTFTSGQEKKIKPYGFVRNTNFALIGQPCSTARLQENQRAAVKMNTINCCTMAIIT